MAGSDLEVDVDTCGPQAPEASHGGPEDLHGLLAWPDRYSNALKAFDVENWTDLHGSVLKKFEAGVVLTSSYSGMGTVEFAADRLRSAFAAAGREVKLVVYSVCESSPAARRALAAHGPETAARHVFTNVSGDLAALLGDLAAPSCRTAAFLGDLAARRERRQPNTYLRVQNIVYDKLARYYLCAACVRALLGLAMQWGTPARRRLAPPASHTRRMHGRGRRCVVEAV